MDLVPRTIRGLAGASHPLPSAAVTAFAAALGAKAGLSAWTLVLLVAAILSGQLSIGWLNDYVDRDADRSTARAEKPLAAGLVGPTAVRRAFFLASLTCVVTSLGLGVRPGLLHLAAVASAYSYDLRLKRTVMSWVPFAFSFGLLPCVVTTALPGGAFPDPAIVLAGAALGVGAHLANTVKDTEADALTGVRGFPQRIGPRRSLLLAACCVAIAGVATVFATPGSWAARVFAGAAVVAAVVVGGAGRRLAFPAIILAAALVVAGVVLSGGAVTS
jgi:4-hydroxybenzoate polyprenyltransferase